MNKKTVFSFIGLVVLIITFFLPFLEFHSFEEETEVKTIFGYENLFFHISFLFSILLVVLRLFSSKRILRLCNWISLTLALLLFIEFSVIFLNPYGNSTSFFLLGYFIHVITILLILLNSPPKNNASNFD